MSAGPLLFLPSLDGGLIVAVLSGLLFIEECGVPLPMAPGDLVLLIAGVALATGRVNPLVLVLCMGGALIVGAFLGREIFARIGPRPLWMIAGRLGATGLLEIVARRLRRGGWCCVFVCRMIPGLRVHTNQVAGALAIPRRSFVVGMVPSALLYITVFLGAGVVFGTAALATIRSVDRWLIVVGVSGALLSAVFIGIARFTRRSHPLETPLQKAA